MIRVEFHKHPGTLHWNYEAHLLGEDEYGLWLGVPAGSRIYKGSEERSIKGAFVQSIAPGRWWTAVRNIGHRTTHYVDIIRPAEWVSHDHVTMVDLDLDVVRLPDGTVEIEDEDEFTAHRVSLGYPDSWVDMARTTAARVYQALETRREPFGDVADGWLAAMIGEPI